ncbi:MAG: SDR family NAD(P)-dependent oxidoreductase [Candidatus Accumulibacter sp.]|nr:SDR family NAD(P)-dependent oxidoreductase [Accumulibacter sp.]
MTGSTPSSPHTVLITGATGGIGGALAQIYAEAGRTLILQGRNAMRLEELAGSCTARGARVLTEVLDLTDRQATDQWLRQVSLAEAPDLVIVNAGLNNNISSDGAGERWQDIRSVLEVNLIAALATIDAVLPMMRARKRGQIALISSLAAYHGLPITPSYCASKAGLKAYGEALRGWLAPEGIWVNVVMPGYVESKMCREMRGPKPFLWPPERAAAYIRRGLARNRARISFPFPLNFGTWWLAVLPAGISWRILRLLNYGA